MENHNCLKDMNPFRLALRSYVTLTMFTRRPKIWKPKWTPLAPSSDTKLMFLNMEEYEEVWIGDSAKNNKSQCCKLFSGESS